MLHVCMCPAPASYISISSQDLESTASLQYSSISLFSKDIVDVSVGLDYNVTNMVPTSFRRTGGLDSDLALWPSCWFRYQTQHHHNFLQLPKSQRIPNDFFDSVDSSAKTLFRQNGICQQPGEGRPHSNAGGAQRDWNGSLPGIWKFAIFTNSCFISYNNP